MRVHEGEAARRSFILKVQIGGELIERELDEGEHVVGSSPQAHIQLADPNRYISRRHAKLIVRGGELFIVDLGSTNGTFVNGRRIEPNEEVKVGTSDRIELADIPIEIRRQS
ncbi:FHA domain-containing protein [Candidatus Poribacteria bacterium]|nr:FHA domain-containing protein [Candidatus Poribacteria bacterium]